MEGEGRDHGLLGQGPDGAGGGFGIPSKVFDVLKGGEVHGLAKARSFSKNLIRNCCLEDECDGNFEPLTRWSFLINDESGAPRPLMTGELNECEVIADAGDLGNSLWERSGMQRHLSHLHLR